MGVRLSFHGAVETVTGSKYLLEAGGVKVLIDCGMFQGLKELRLRNWDPFPFTPAGVDAVVVTHAHIDHVGMLPKLVRDGFHGQINGTPATVEIAELSLFDSANNQEEDANYANKKGYSKHHPAQPLFDSRDVERTVGLFQARRRGEWFTVAGPVRARYQRVGHLLGAACVEIEVLREGQPLRLLFSGDVGRYNAPLYFDPDPPPACDYLICESTYGDRDHPAGNMLDELERVVKQAVARGGVLLVASFAIGRAQQLIYLLQVLMHAGRIPRMPIYLDSPMAIDATGIFRRYVDEHDLSEGRTGNAVSALDGRNVHFARSAAESKEINAVEGPAVIIASSGMMIGGRILHHLKQRLSDPKNTIVLGGYMAAGTRGRQLQEGKRWIRMHGQDIPVRASVVGISGLSGHADRTELLRWLAPVGKPRRTFITHGEPESAAALAETLRSTRRWDVVTPRMDQSFDLEPAE
jgi:metallo-beta-lactamase family protein